MALIVAVEYAVIGVVAFLMPDVHPVIRILFLGPTWGVVVMAGLTFFRVI